MNQAARLVFLFAAAMLFCSAVAAQGQPDKNGIVIDKRPLRDFSALAKKQVADGSVKLDRPFLLEFELVLDKASRVDLSKSRVTKLEGDGKMADLANQGIIAVARSGWFQYLSRTDNITIDKIFVMVRQNDTEFLTSIAAQAATEPKARTLASSFSLLLNVATLRGEQVPESVMKMLRATSAMSSGRNLIVRFALPAAEFQSMVRAEMSK